MSQNPTNAPTTSTALAVATPAWTAGIYGQLDAARPVAELLSKSELVPKQFAGKPMDILIAGAMGARLGLDLFSSLAGIAVVNGRATLWGDALLAVCQQHPQFEDYHQEITGEGEQMAASVTVKRKGRSPHTEMFSVADAKRAGLWGKQGPWTQHPKRMMALRARAFALRTVFADALAGFHAKEELDDEPREVEATVHSEPRPAKRRTAPTVDAPPAPQGQGTATAQPQPDDRADEECAAAEKAASGKTLGEHAADAGIPAEQPASQPAKPEPTVARCQDVTAALMKRGAGGKALVAGIMKRWSLRDVAQLGELSAEDRQAYIDEVLEADAKLEG